MVHYYLGLAIVLGPALVATLVTGAFHDGSQTHLGLGLFTSILSVATNTLLILFMIVTGRVLKAAVASRSLQPTFLGELNEFFAKKRAYPVALLSATVAVAAAVLGYGRFIGVPAPVHMLLGLAAVLVNLASLVFGVRTLRENQSLLDRAAAELDRIDAIAAPPPPDAGEPAWAVGHSTRWLIFAASAWLPYLYWGLVVWHGAFALVSPWLPALSALLSAAALAVAWRSRGSETGAR